MMRIVFPSFVDNWKYAAIGSSRRQAARSPWIFSATPRTPPASSCSSRSRQARTRPHNWRPSMNSARSRRPSRCSCCFVNCASKAVVQPATGRGPGMLQPGRRPRTLHRRAHRQRPARMARPGRPQAAARLCPAGPAHAGERPLQRPRTPRPGAGQAVADRLGEHRGAPGDTAERPLHGLPQDVRRSPGGARRRHRRGLSPGALGGRRAARQEDGDTWFFEILRGNPGPGIEAGRETPAKRWHGLAETLDRSPRLDPLRVALSAPASIRAVARPASEYPPPWSAATCAGTASPRCAPATIASCCCFPRAPGRNTRSRWWTGCANSNAGTTTMRR